MTPHNASPYKPVKARGDRSKEARINLAWDLVRENVAVSGHRSARSIATASGASQQTVAIMAAAAKALRAAGRVLSTDWSTSREDAKRLKEAAPTPFQSRQEVTEAVRDPRYAKDAAYRAEINTRLRLTTPPAALIAPEDAARMMLDAKLDNGNWAFSGLEVAQRTGLSEEAVTRLRIQQADALAAAPATPSELALPVPGAEPLTMSSREIAELTGKAHFNVLRDTKRMLEDLELEAIKFEGSYRAENNKENPEYHLPKDLSICLVAGYDAKLRLTIIRRWEELETAAAPALPAPSSGDVAPRIASLERAVMDLTRMVGELVNRPAPLALAAPERTPPLITAARFKAKHGYTHAIFNTGSLGQAAAGIANQHDETDGWLASRFDKKTGTWHRTEAMWQKAAENLFWERNRALLNPGK